MLIILWLTACDNKTQGEAALYCSDGPLLRDGPVFIDKSFEWGLEAVLADGFRISAFDFDSDGWPDILIRKGDVPDDFTGTRQSWLLRNTRDGSFEDVTETSGLWSQRDGNSNGRYGQVVAGGDVNNDGYMDIFTSAPLGGAIPSELMLGTGDGDFELGPADSDILGSIGQGAGGASFTDFNRDGNLDLWLARASTQQDQLFWGMGDGQLIEVTQAMGLNTQAWSNIDSINEANGHSVAWSSLACDLNNDNYPELLAASYGRAPNHLWLNLSGTSFENISVSSGYAYDNRMDWSDNESARCWCLLNPTDEECENVPPPEAIQCSSDEDAFRWDHQYDREAFRLGGNSGTTVCADIDNDGWMDLLTTEIVHWDVGGSSDPSEILWNAQSSIPEFERPGNEETGLTRTHDINDWNDGDITAAVFDYDNDMLLDVLIGSTDYSGTRALLYRQVSPRQFEPVPIDLGIDHTRSHGVAVSDFDRDGDLDLLLGHSSGRCDEDCYDSFHVRLYENQLLSAGNWIQMELIGGNGSNMSAIGARVEVTAGGVTQTQIVGGGHGHYGMQNEFQLHFGLGENCDAEVQITWPNEGLSVQRFSLFSGSRSIILQGEDPQIIFEQIPND